MQSNSTIQKGIKKAGNQRYGTPYSKMEEGHLQETFSRLAFNGGEWLLDIGCGKVVI